jgi:4-amino-4-deoxy-L-arabinose transferase-like glycosyltransferase
MPQMKSSRAVLIALAMIVGAGAFLRCYGLTIGFPFQFHVDEWFLIDSVMEMYRTGSFRPRAFDYPSLVYYVLLLETYALSLFKQPALYDLYLLGRITSVLFGTATIIVVFRIGRHCYSVATGLIGSALFALAVTAFREAHYFTTDSLNVFFITLAVYYVVRIGAGDGTQFYWKAGIAIGLAAGSKYNGIFLAIPLLFAHLAQIVPAGSTLVESLRIVRKPRRVFSSLLLGAGAIAVAVFIATTPYAVIEPSVFFHNLARASRALSQNVVEGNHHYLTTTPYWYYIENLLFWAMGPVTEVACLLGLCYAAARHRKQDVIMLIWVLLYFAVVGGWLNKAVRYTLPMLPFLALFAANLFVEGRRYFLERGQRMGAVVTTTLALLTLASSLFYAGAYLNIYRQEHSEIQAIRWAAAHIPSGSTILLEGPTPHERPQPDAPNLIYPNASFQNPGNFKFLFLEVPDFSRKDVDEKRARAALNDLLKEVDYIMMSTRWYEGLVQSREASPVIKDYYGRLRNGAAGFDLVREIAVYPGLFRFEINDDRSELNFRIFDHPKVWIFRKRTANPEAVNASKG